MNLNIGDRVKVVSNIMAEWDSFIGCEGVVISTEADKPFDCEVEISPEEIVYFAASELEVIA